MKAKQEMLGCVLSILVAIVVNDSAEAALLMRSYSHANIAKQILVHDFEVPQTAQRLHITYADAADPPKFAARVAQSVGLGSNAYYTDGLTRAIVAAVDHAIDVGTGADVGTDAGVFAAGLNISEAAHRALWMEPMVQLNDAQRLCGGTRCYTGDVPLFEDLRSIIRSRARELVEWQPVGATVSRELLLAPWDEIHEARLSFASLVTSPIAGGATDLTLPWEAHLVRIAHGDMLKFLDFHSGETAPNGLQYSQLAHRLRHRAVFRARIWREPLQSPDAYNEEIQSVRVENLMPFPPRGVWPMCDSALNRLERNWEALFQEFKDLNAHDMRHGRQLEEHEQGLQRYAFNTSLWLRSTFWRAGTCRNSAFAKACALFQDIQDSWKPNGMTFFEIKYLTVWPGTWIRPHTADNNQVMKIHLGLQNPHRQFMLRAGNETRVWQQGKAFLFDDSYLHEVTSSAPDGGAPRVVLDVKFTHPDLHTTRGIGVFSSLPQRHVDGRPAMTNQLIEKIVALDGDIGRSSYRAFVRVMRRHGWQKVRTLCADLDLDHHGNELRTGTVTVNPDDFNVPAQKRTCLKRLMALWVDEGFTLYEGDSSAGLGRNAMSVTVPAWLNGETDIVPPCWVEPIADEAYTYLEKHDFGSSDDPHLLGHTCANEAHCARNHYCEHNASAVGGHCRDCVTCAAVRCKQRCRPFLAVTSTSTISTADTDDVRDDDERDEL